MRDFEKEMMRYCDQIAFSETGHEFYELGKEQQERIFKQAEIEYHNWVSDMAEQMREGGND